MPETPNRYWIWHLDETLQMELWRAATPEEAAWALENGIAVYFGSSREVYGIRCPRMLGPDDVDIAKLRKKHGKYRLHEEQRRDEATGNLFNT